MNTVVQAVPGTGMGVRVPEGWRSMTDPQVGLLAVEDVQGRFAASLTTVLDPSLRELPAAPASSAVAPLVSPVLLDLQVEEHGVALLLCHLAGGISATARQRQILVPEGLLVLTFTAATSRWAEMADLADDVLDSLERAS